MPTIHILNGEHLATQLRTSGLADALIVWNECLVDGPVEVTASPAFWAQRSAFIATHYAAAPDDYAVKVLAEYDKLAALPVTAEVHLWFEHDLFCQVNFWFLLAQLAGRGWQGRLWRVAPQRPADADMWRGFGGAEAADLRAALAARVPIHTDDLLRGQALWRAFASGAHVELLALCELDSAVFPHLREVCQAHVDRFPAQGLGRPQRVLAGLRAELGDDFGAIFAAFTRQEGIYGLGDSQVMTMLKEFDDFSS